jgi:exosortase
VLVIAGLFAAVFWPNLRRLWLKTNPFTGEANWSHAVVVPIIGLYYLFVHREDLVRAGSRQFIWGPLLRKSRAVAGGAMLVVGGVIFLLCRSHASLFFSMFTAGGAATGAIGAMVLLLDWSFAWIIFGLGVFVYGIYPGQNDYLKDLGMVITVFGIVLMLSGPEVMKIAWFPIVFLICAIPWPGLVYSWIAEPLQTMAAAVAVHVLSITGVDSVVSGTKIVIFNSNPLQPPRVLNVAEACAGMRSLMTFISVGAAIAFLSSRPLWQKLIIVVSAIPIAIFCNVMRISGQGLLDHYVSPQWSESFAHQFVGMMMLLPAFFLILGVGYLLDKLFIEEAEEGDADFRSTPKTVAGISVRDSAIPALGTISSIASPLAKAAVAAPVVPAAPPALPAPVTKPVTVQKPVLAAPAPSPSKGATAPSKPAIAPAPSTGPARVVASPASGTLPPRPVTPANPRPVPPAYGLPPRPGFVPPRAAVPQNGLQNTAQQRRPAEPLRPANRSPASPATEMRRVPPQQPNSAKAGNSQPNLEQK